MIIIIIIITNKISIDLQHKPKPCEASRHTEQIVTWFHFNSLCQETNELKRRFPGERQSKKVKAE